MIDYILDMLPVLQFEDMGPDMICGGAFCFLWIIPLIIWILIGVWLYKDAEKRGKNGVLWLLVGLVAGIIGLIIWLIVRPSMEEVRREKEMERQYQQQQYRPPQE
ncbi:MAG: hypothetical protein ACOC85_01700 [Thermoplasmatota archaeon]